ncbi:cyclin-P3-1-like [Chenopodium quinoa]|uniref:cyclin-P3-1-like n=1 Tax=Chenopodium quinoa TaxID=63459 RepID=UPI000B77E85D|nr:cyclin-P3-1-like [Chenopodium quinoa]
MGTFNTKSRNSELYKTLGLLDKPPLLEDASEKPPQIVSLIASVLERNIHKNDKLFKKSKTKDGVTIFHGSKAPTLNIRQYMDRVFKYSKCSPSCFVVAYIYMDKFIQSTNCYLTSLNAHRLLIASVLLAAKFIEDVTYNNAHFAKVGGVSISEMNKLELKLLCSLDYKLHVTVETFDQYCLQLEKAAGSGNERRSCHNERAMQTCGLKGSWLKKDESKCTPKFTGYTCGAI